MERLVVGEDSFMKVRTLEIRSLNNSLERSLLDFFGALVEAGDNEYFHPHPFDPQEAQRLANYAGPDLYYVLVEGNQVLGYGMLRGWEEGYEIPSLGIAIHPLARGLGLGKLLMLFLHASARRCGAARVRLKVYADNQPAICLYEKLGYVFLEKDNDGQLVGFIDL